MASEEHVSKDNHTLSSTTLFARNLPFTVEDKDLEKVFSEVGPVKRCFVVKDKENPGKCRGFGYITFALKEDAVRAKDTVRHINGRKVFLAFSNKKPRHRNRNQEDKKEPEENNNNDGKNNDLGENDDLLVGPSFDGPVENSEKPKRKAKSERAVATSADGRTIVLSGFLVTANLKQLKKACKRFGEVEQFIYPVENYENPTAHVVYKTHKICRIAAKGLMGKTVKGSVLDAVVLSKQNKTQSVKSIKKSRLIIRNLPFKCTKGILMKEFSKFGQVTEVVLPEKTVGKNRKKLGFAFVQFKTVFEAAKALEEMNKKEIKGRAIAVDWTLPKKKYELLKTGDNNQDNAQQSTKNENLDEVSSNISEEVDLADDNEDESDNEKSSSDELNDEESEIGNSEESGNDESRPGESDIDDEDDNRKAKSKKRKLRDAREGKTIFIRNLPFDATEEEICSLFEKFGKIAYCKIVVDGVSEHSRGSAFLKFEEKHNAEDCLSKCSGDDGDFEEITLKNRPLNIALAVPKGKVSKLLEEKDSSKKCPRDKRNLYLAKEGLITPGSQAAVGLAKSDLQKRQKAEVEKKAKLAMPHYMVSKTRLCFRNLPLNVDNKKLAEMLRKVCDDKPRNVGKVQVMRSNDRLDSSGLPRSKGFGFVELHSHEDALEILRATNNNPKIFGPDRRPIVEFAIENSLILKRQDQRKIRNKQKQETKQQESLDEKPQGEKKKGRKRKRENKQHRSRVIQQDGGEHEDEEDHKYNQITPRKKLTTNDRVSKMVTEHAQIRPKHRPKAQKMRNNTNESNATNLTSLDNTNGVSAQQLPNAFSSRSKHKQRERANKEEENFNNIVEKYKSKLFGADNKQLKTSRWFQ